MKSATSPSTASLRLISVSIHALVKSATTCSYREYQHLAGFNPRAREERDSQSSQPESLGSIVSIHALVKSATGTPSETTLHQTGFNPRAREERDFVRTPKTSTLSCFNPRAREERDYEAFAGNVPRMSVSIHALVKSATRIEPSVSLFVTRFQSTRS